MKQLELDFKEKEHHVPDFETWYSENSHERRTFGEKPYNRMKAYSVYADLVESNFFKGAK